MLESASNRKDAENLHYIETLINDGAITPIDADIDTYEIHLPPWFDEEKFKRCVNVAFLYSHSTVMDLLRFIFLNKI